MKIYGVYDTKNKDECIICGSLEQIAKYFKITGRTINVSIRNKKYKDYDFLYLFDEKEGKTNV